MRILLPVLALVVAVSETVNACDGHLAESISQPFLSADGSRLGFSYGGRLYVVDRRGGTADSLSKGIGFEARGRFSPGGDLLALFRTRATHRSLIVRNLNTGIEYELWPDRSWNETQIDGLEKFGETLGVVIDYQFGASRSDLIVSTTHGVYIVDIFDRSAAQLLDMSVSGFSVSRTDGGIVFARNSFTPMGRGEVSVVQFSGAVVANFGLGRGKGIASPVVKEHDHLLFTEWDGGVQRIVRTDLNGRAREALYVARGGELEFAVDETNDALVVVDNGCAYEVSLDDGSLQPIPIELPYSPAKNEGGSFYITNAMLFSGLPAQTVFQGGVLVEQGRISEAFSGAAPSDRRTITRIDVQGQFLMAGMVDAHAHIDTQSPFRLQDELAVGVTSIISPATRLPDRLSVATIRMEKGLLAGPWIHAFSPHLDGVGPTVPPTHSYGGIADTGGIKNIVGEFRRKGYAGVKLYSSLSPEVAAAVIKEAQAQGLLTLGHLGRTSWEEGIEFGISGLTHLSTAVAACKTFPGAGNREAPPYWEPDFDCLDKLLFRMAEAGVSFDPTLVDNTPVFWPAGQLESYREFERGPPAEDIYEWNSAIIKMAIEHGVNVTIGRDDWDWSLVYEMEAYEEIGVPRADILRMATVNAAKFLNKEHEFGTVEVGKRADLVLVNGNPLERIGDLRNISMVIKEGAIVVNRLDDDAVTSNLTTIH